MMARAFTHSRAKRVDVPLLIGIAGESGSGKTLSALRVATGIQRVTRGDIFVVDTESNRATHYAPAKGERADPANGTYDFEHVPFGEPYSPDDYLDCFRHCVASGAGIIVVDSFSHEHEGSGGVLEQHDKEVDRLVDIAKTRYGGNPSREKYNFPAWAKPKQKRIRLKTAMVGMPCTFILCFRAKEKVKPSKGDLVELGWMPIGGKEYLFEMTLRALLPSNASGVPQFTPKRAGESTVYKLPRYFERIFKTPHALCESDGEAMARWAAGPKDAGRPCFGKKLQWQGKDKWGGKPLGDADAEALGIYALALGDVARSAKGKALAVITAHADDVERIRQLKGT